MAEATARLITKIVVTEVEEEVQDGFTLELSDDEAVALRAILRRVGGDPHTTRRGLADDIGAALETAGIAKDNYPTDITGSIYFSPKELSDARNW